MEKRIESRLAMVLCLVLLVQIIVPSLWSSSAQASSASPDISIQFGVPAAPAGGAYIPDYGELYGERNGYTYGWNFDHTSYSVGEAVYGSSISSSSIVIQPGGQWEIALPSGGYEVEISVGNAVYGSVNTLQVEDVVFWDQFVIAAGDRDTMKKRVQVKDGKLTLKGDAASPFTSIHALSITKIVPAIRQMSLPYIGLPAVQNKQPGDTILISSKQNSQYNAIPSIKVGGLGQAIGTYLTSMIQPRIQPIRR
jgi:hypothetical protein